MPSDQYISLGDSVRGGRAKIILQHQITKEEVTYVSKDYKQPRGKSKVDIIFMKDEVEEIWASDGEDSSENEEGSSLSEEEKEFSSQQSSSVEKGETLETHPSETSSASPLEKEESSLQDISEKEDTRGRSLQKDPSEKSHGTRSWSPRPWGYVRHGTHHC